MGWAGAHVILLSLHRLDRQDGVATIANLRCAATKSRPAARVLVPAVVPDLREYVTVPIVTQPPTLITTHAPIVTRVTMSSVGIMARAMRAAA